MRLPSKVTLLAVALALTTNAAVAKSPDLKNENDRLIYAFGASFAKSFEQFFTEQTELGVKLDSDILIAGIQDNLSGKSKLSDEEVQATIKTFQDKMTEVARKKMEAQEKVLQEEAIKSATEGTKYREDFAKQKNVEKATSGLLYRVDKQGTGDNPKSSDTVVVHYKGTLINGTVFDSSYERGEPVTFPLDSVIEGWREGLTYVKKGGKITLVIPPEHAYGDRAVGEIPGNSTLVFEVELQDINPAPTADNK